MATANPQYPAKILLAVDGSDHFHAALELLRDLPLPRECSVAALAVIPTQQATHFSALEVVLEQTRETLEKKGVRVQTDLKAGNPAETINQYADLNSPDMIALGAKGLRGTLGILLGGVAQQVVEYARWPVLVVRAPYKGLRRVLLATDGSEHSQRAVDYLAHFTLPEGVSVRVIHVLPPPPVPDLIARSWPVGAEVMMPIPTPEMEAAAQEQAEEERRQGEKILAQTVAALKSAGVVAEGVLVRGDAASEIIDYVKEHEIDLVVVGSRGLSQVRGWLLGSVSRKLVHYAGCSVLLIKGMPEAAV